MWRMIDGGGVAFLYIRERFERGDCSRLHSIFFFCFNEFEERDDLRCLKHQRRIPTSVLLSCFCLLNLPMAWFLLAPSFCAGDPH